MVTRLMRRTLIKDSNKSLVNLFFDLFGGVFDILTYHAKCRICFGCDFFDVFRPMQIRLDYNPQVLAMVYGI